MLKTLKWIYNLGVNQERTRLAAYLDTARHQASIQHSTMYDMMHNDAPKMSAKRKDRLAFDMAVEQRVEEIINGMFRADEQYVMGSSILYPDEGRKK